MVSAPSLSNELLQLTLASLLDVSNEGIVVFDSQGICQQVGRAAAELFGLAAGTLLHRSYRDVLTTLDTLLELPDASELDESQAPEHLGLTTPGVAEVRVRKSRRILAWRALVLRAEGPELGRLVVVRDVTQERNAERATRQLLTRIEHLAATDALTGIANQVRFVEQHAREHARAMRSWDSYAVLWIDIDGIHRINSVQGKSVGDEAIRRVARAACVERRDYDLVARWRTDELVVLLPGADAIACDAVARRILSTLASLNPPEAERGVTVSVGAAVCAPPSGESADDVMRRCGEALDAARTRGTGQIQVDVLANP